MEGKKPAYYKGKGKINPVKVSNPGRAHWSRRSKLFDEPELRILGWQPGMNIDDMGYMKGPEGTFDTYGLGSFKQKYGGGMPSTSLGQRASVDWSADGYRLPTLAEWTIACRDESKTKFYWGDNPDLEGTNSWSWQNSDGKTQKVAAKPANSRGLYDMLGNVFEMCWGQTNKRKNQGSQETWNPKGAPDTGGGIGASHLMQGGSFLHSSVWSSSNYAFNTGGGNPKQGNRQSSSIWNWNAFTHLGFRPIRCKSRTHRSSGSEMPDNVLLLDVNLQEPVTPLQGQTHRGNLQRTGLFYSQSIKTQPKVKWKVKLPGKIKSCPMAFRDSVYIGTDKGFFYAFDTETGEEKWKFKMAGGPLGETGKGFHGNIYPTTPTIKDNVLYMGSSGGYLYALDIKTGRAKWSTTMRGAKMVLGSPMPAYGAVFAAITGYGKDNGLMAVHQETGMLLTIYRGIRPVKTSMSFAEGTLLVGQKLLDMRSASVKGGANQGGNYGGNNTTALYKGNMYAVGGWEGMVSAIKSSNYRSASKIYSVNIEPEDTINIRNGTADNTLSIWDDKLYFGTRQGYLYSCETSTGKRLWKTKLPAKTAAASIISTTNNSKTAVVYIGCDNGSVCAIDATTGSILWEFKTGSRVWLDAWISEGVLYVASDDGYLYALTE